jgi:lipopolysaccharide export system permease protein
MYLPELLSISEDEARGRPLGSYRAEAHEALSGPLYVLVLPLIAVAFVVSAGFRRQGFVGRIILATGVAVAIRLAGLAMKGAASSSETLWPAMYAPPVLGVAVALWLLAGRPLPWRRLSNRDEGGNARAVQP